MSTATIDGPAVTHLGSDVSVKTYPSGLVEITQQRLVGGRGIETVFLTSQQAAALVELLARTGGREGVQ